MDMNLVAEIAAKAATQAVSDYQESLHTKAPGTNFLATPLHGLTNVGAGIFSTPGLDRNVISTVVRPFGIASILPMYPSVDTNPRYGALTGVSDDIGDEPVNPCDDAPTGYIKACNLTAQFGRVPRQTQTIEFDQVMLKINRGDFSDLRLIGELLGGSPFMPSGLNQQQVVNLVTMSEMLQAGIRLERKLSTIMWSGSPANNTAGGGYKEFPGLANQIVTGQVDADTGTLCPSLDSDVKDFTFNNIDGTDGKDIVEYLSMLEFFLRQLADDTGMSPVEWVIAAHPALWQELTATWPCAYNTNRCGAVGGTNARVFTDGRENIRDRDRMRNDLFIEINGNSYRVVKDNSIPELTPTDSAQLAPGEYASNIYMVPLRVNGAFPVTYMEYVDYNAGVGDLRLLNGRESFWTDNGRFLWAIDDLRQCYDLYVKTEPRVVLRTPQLAGVVQNIKYSPLQHIRQPDPDSPYWVNGGVSFREPGTQYAAWL